MKVLKLKTYPFLVVIVASAIEVFVTQNMHSAVHYGGLEETRLPWDSYDACGSSTNDMLTTTSAVIQCQIPLSGRWVLLRRAFRPLHICLLQIYVDKGMDLSHLLTYT